jgi:uncharacterized membrane protein
MAIEFEPKYLFLAVINFIGAICLIITIFIGITQILINSTVGEKIDTAIKSIKERILKRKEKDEVVNLYGDNIILGSLFITTLAIGIGLIVKGVANIMNENTNNILNARVRNC